MSRLVAGVAQGLDALLCEKLGITSFHSALAHFKEPSWFNHANWKKAQSVGGEAPGRGRRAYTELAEQARDVWGARGPAAACARALPAGKTMSVSDPFGTFQTDGAAPTAIQKVLPMVCVVRLTDGRFRRCYAARARPMSVSLGLGLLPLGQEERATKRA